MSLDMTLFLVKMTENSVKIDMAKIIDKEEKKAEILNAAIKVLGEKGIAGTKIQDIAEAAGIAKGTVYLYFKNKDEILHSILQLHISSKGSETMQLHQSDEAPENVFRKILAGFVSSMNSTNYPPGLHLEILANMVRNKDNKELKKSLTVFRDMLSDILSKIDRKNSSPSKYKALSSGLISMIHGAIILWSVDEKQFPFEGIMEEMTELLLRDLKT